jgi:hypothetical protein
MEVTMTTPDSGDQTFLTVNVVLDLCVIVSLDPPTDPTDLAYLIFAVSPLTIDLSSPGFQQVPACGYYLVETFTWDIPSDAPITENTSGGNTYAVDVASTEPSDDGSYTVTLNLSALYATLVTTYTQSISFTVTVTDPCLTTTYETVTLSQMTFEAGASTTQDFD